MAVIIYKQSHEHLNGYHKSETPGVMAGYVKYIATRPGAVLNEGEKNALFGRINAALPLTPYDSEDFTGVIKKVYADSSLGKVHYKSVISLKDVTAKELDIYRLSEDGFEDDRRLRLGWERYIESHVRMIAEKNGIDPADLGYVCAVHKKEEATHAHIVFWDNTAKGSIPPPVDERAGKRIAGIRRRLIMDSFPEELALYKRLRQEAYHAMRDGTALGIRQLEDRLSDDDAKNFEDALELSETGLKADDAYAASAAFNEIRQIIKLSPDGIYSSAGDGIQNQCRDLAKLIRKNHPQIRKLSDTYANAKRLEGSLFFDGGADPDERTGRRHNNKFENELILKREAAILKREKSLEDSIIETLARRIYNSAKTFNREDMQRGRDTANAASCAVRLIAAMEKELRSMPPPARDTGKPISRELSKDAKKERIAKEREDHGSRR